MSVYSEGRRSGAPGGAEAGRIYLLYIITQTNGNLTLDIHLYGYYSAIPPREAKSLTSASAEPLLRDAVHEAFRSARVICSDHALTPSFRHGRSAATRPGASHLIPPDAAVKQRNPLFSVADTQLFRRRVSEDRPRSSLLSSQEGPGTIKSFGRCESSKVFSFLSRYFFLSLLPLFSGVSLSVPR